MRKPPAIPKKNDALGRRFSFVRQSTGRKINLTEADLLRLEFLHRHGDLPTPFLHEYTKHLQKSERATKYRLRDLFHEKDTLHGGPYLERPPQQLRTEYPERNYIVHRVSKHGLKALEQAGRMRENTPKSSSSWEHDFLRSCYSASIELACMAKPDQCRFIHHDTVINNAIKKTGRAPAFKVASETFNPDLMFGIQHRNAGSVRLLAVEIDMMTESIRSKRQKTKTVEQSLRQYRQYIKTGRYKKEFAFGGSFCLITVTVNPTHAVNMMKIAPSEEFLLFNWVPNFEYHVKPPEPMPWLFTEPYDRPGHDPLYINQL